MVAIAPDRPLKRKLLAKAKGVAPYLLLGPISGPLCKGVVTNFREGRPVLGSLYAIALVEITLFLPYITIALGIKLI
jgi:hypothetical protein